MLTFPNELGPFWSTLHAYRYYFVWQIHTGIILYVQKSTGIFLYVQKNTGIILYVFLVHKNTGSFLYVQKTTGIFLYEMRFVRTEYQRQRFPS